MKDQDEFPRKLELWEKELLFSLLPENKAGYAKYRNKIASMEVIGTGRNGDLNLILGESGDKTDPDIPPSPVFAAGTARYESGDVYIVIHEELEHQIECDISPDMSASLPPSAEMKESLTISGWIPGHRLYDGTFPREIHLIKGEIVLCLSREHKRVWVYERKSGVNHFIPVTGFYEALVRAGGKHEPGAGLKTGLLFANEAYYTDQDLGAAFLLYNKAWKKIELDYTLFIEHSKNEKRGSFLNFFKRG